VILSYHDYSTIEGAHGFLVSVAVIIINMHGVKIKMSIPTVGETIKIVGNSNDHPFEIGQIVTVLDWYDFEETDAPYGVEAAAHPETEHWFVRHSDYVKM
jgi:hypothetical protein